MKASELRELSSEELTKRVRELKQELLNMRLQRATGQLENPHRLGFVRKDIARILQILTQRSSQAAAKA